MKYIVIFILTFSVLFSQNNLQDNFFDTIMIDQIERIYPNDNIVKPSSYIISMHFDLNRYRLNEPITMEIKIYAKKGSVSFTNSDNPFNNYKFKVYDNYNNEIVSSDNYTLWKYKNERNTESNNRIITLAECEIYSYFIDLKQQFHTCLNITCVWIARTTLHLDRTPVSQVVDVNSYYQAIEFKTSL